MPKSVKTLDEQVEDILMDCRDRLESIGIKDYYVTASDPDSDTHVGYYGTKAWAYYVSRRFITQEDTEVAEQTRLKYRDLDDESDFDF